MSAPAVKAPGTLGMVNAHNREMTLSSVDLSLPSPRMPLVFERFYLGQDHFEGPFGPGWDTPYNQRITEVPAGSVPVGSKMLIVYRGSDDYDTAARAGDVLLHTGDGRVL
ncbi:MAG: hypothetical protein IT384_29730, partial [Deltaproteobacteria bacterium]|nr:hypothetical protein [Deltaproteobacteria bacterium]